MHLFVCATFAASVQITVEGCRAVVDGVPIPEPAFCMILALLTAICLGWNEEKVIDVVVSLQRTFGSTDDSWGTFFQVVAKQRLLVVSSLKILEISTINIV